MQIQIASVSGHVVHYIFKKLSNRCRHDYDPSFSRIFCMYTSHFWRVFDVWPSSSAENFLPATHSFTLEQMSFFCILHTYLLDTDFPYRATCKDPQWGEIISESIFCFLQLPLCFHKISRLLCTFLSCQNYNAGS